MYNVCNVQNKYINNFLVDRNFVQSGEWNINSIKVESLRQQFPCCRDEFAAVAYTLELSRFPLFYFLYIFFPILSQFFLFLMVFILFNFKFRVRVRALLRPKLLLAIFSILEWSLYYSQKIFFMYFHKINFLKLKCNDPMMSLETEFSILWKSMSQEILN